MEDYKERNKIVIFSPILGNLISFRRELILSLCEKGYNVTLVCDYDEEYEEFSKFGVHYVKANVDRRGSNPLTDLKTLWLYIKFLRLYKPDIALTYTTKCSVYAGIACRITNTAYIINNSGIANSVNRSKLFDVFLRIMYRLGFNGTACMMFQNSVERDYFLPFLKSNLHWILLPGSGVNINRYNFSHYPDNDNSIVFNYVARVTKMKGIDEFLACAKFIKAKYPYTRFVMYGNCEDLEYSEIIKHYQNEGIVEYMGMKKYLRPFIEACHAVIHPSYSEGMTNVILEHAAMGRTSLASNIPGCKDSIDNFVSGILFEPRSKDALIEAVESFIKLSNKDKASMGRAAREKMMKEFDRQIVVDYYLSEIKRVLS